METEDKTLSSERTEDTNACDNVEIPRVVDEDSGNINLCSSPDRTHDKLPEKVIKEHNDVLIVSDDRDMNESNDGKRSDSSDAGEKIDDTSDKSKSTVDAGFDTSVACDVVRSETDVHTAINNEVEERDSDSSVEFLSEIVNKDVNLPHKRYAEAEKNVDSIKTTEVKFKEELSVGSDSCDVLDSETNLLVEKSVNILPVQIDTNVSDVSEEKTLHSVIGESGNVDTPIKKHSDESKSLDGSDKKVLISQEPAIEPQNANQKKDDNGPSCLDHSSTVQLLSEENPNSDSDMDIDNEVNSDPEILFSKLPNESDPDGSMLSSTKLPDQSETQAPKLECGPQINEEFISAMLLAPEDMIIECKDKKNFFYCNVCHCSIHNSIKNVKVHKKGKSHKAALIKHKKTVVTAVKNMTSTGKSAPHLMFLDCYVERYKPRGYYCRICNFIAEKLKAMDDHVHGNWHETNICIMKTREISAQQKDNTDKGTKDEMKELDEEYFKILESERLKSWNSYSSAIAEDVSKNNRTINMESCYNVQDPSLYSSSKDGFPQNQYYQNFMNTTNQDMFGQSPAMQNPVADASELQQAKVSKPSQENNSLFNVPFSINKEGDSEIVFEVINSLLQSYLKYKLGRLPKSLFKLPHNSKSEEYKSHIDRFDTSRNMEQSFRNSQNSKNRYQSDLSPNDARNSSDMYRSIPNKYMENRSYKRTYANETSNEKLHENYRSYKPSLMEDKTNESYHYLCSDDQMRKPVAPRSFNIKRQNEGNFSINLKETESIIEELRHYEGSYRDDSPKRIRLGKSFSNDSYGKYKNYEEADVSSHLIRQNESADYNFLKQYKSPVNEQNKSFINDLPQQYQHFKKDNTAARSTKELEQYATDSSDVYVRGSNIEDAYARKPRQNTQSIFQLMKKFRNSNFPHY